MNEFKNTRVNLLEKQKLYIQEDCWQRKIFYISFFIVKFKSFAEKIVRGYSLIFNLIRGYMHWIKLGECKVSSLVKTHHLFAEQRCSAWWFKHSCNLFDLKTLDSNNCVSLTAPEKQKSCRHGWCFFLLPRFHTYRGAHVSALFPFCFTFPSLFGNKRSLTATYNKLL